jgi:hypothetical protein
VGSWTADASSETSVGTRKLVEIIEKSGSDVIVHTTEVCKSMLSDQWIPDCKG